MNETNLDDVAVVIPAFNEGSRISETVHDLSGIFKNVIVVDDGSSDNTFSEASQTYARVLKHPINLGQGAALQTGITKALENKDIQFILTFDADGQHSVDSAVAMIHEIKTSKVEIILGSRFLEKNAIGMPSKKKIILRLGIAFTRIDSGLKVTDTHNGLRVMNRKFASSLQIKHAGMAHASEILNHIKDVGATWKEFPAQIYYTEYSMRKGQSVLNAVNILTEMLYK
jgi:glycosyltransferase involved in cell wall biosynthesis